jgi:protocatechuate 3,4-dioxygenase beta subunit
MKRKADDRAALTDPTRRVIVRALMGMPMLGLIGCSAGAADTVISTIEPPALTPTPACGDADDGPTPVQTEGPYFTPNSPERASLIEAGITGTRLIVTGRVLSTACAPIRGALLDVWQADDAGRYDNAGYRLRGHQFSDGEGRFSLETIVPGLYAGRTRHIHVKVQPRNGAILTTQLYFPREPRNSTDRIYSADLLLAINLANGIQNGVFNFVLPV